MKNEKIVLDGVEYDIDVQAGIESGILKENRKYKAGDIFLITCHVDGYEKQSYAILANVDYRTYVLIDLEDGNRWINCKILPPRLEDGDLRMDFIRSLAGVTSTNISFVHKKAFVA